MNEWIHIFPSLLQSFIHKLEKAGAGLLEVSTGQVPPLQDKYIAPTSGSEIQLWYELHWVQIYQNSFIVNIQQNCALLLFFKYRYIQI